MSHCCISVNQTIAECDDLLLVCKSARDLREELERLTKSLANHLEVAFYCSPEHRIILIFVQLLALRELLYVAYRLLNVPQISPQATRHTAVPDALQFLA